MQVKLSWVDIHTGEMRQPVLNPPIAFGQALNSMPKDLKGRRISRMVLADDQVAPFHAIWYVRNGQLHINDRGSSSGTKVNDVALRNQPLYQGDRIQIGSYTIRVDAIAASLRKTAQPAPAPTRWPSCTPPPAPVHPVSLAVNPISHPLPPPALADDSQSGAIAFSHPPMPSVEQPALGQPEFGPSEDGSALEQSEFYPSQFEQPNFEQSDFEPQEFEPENFEQSAFYPPEPEQPEFEYSELERAELRHQGRSQITQFAPDGTCDRQVVFLFKRRCGRRSTSGCPHCQSGQIVDDPFFYDYETYYPGYGNYRRGYWGHDYYRNRDRYAYDSHNRSIDFTEADAASFEEEGDRDYEMDLDAS